MHLTCTTNYLFHHGGLRAPYKPQLTMLTFIYDGLGITLTDNPTNADYHLVQETSRDGWKLYLLTDSNGDPTQFSHPSRSIFVTRDAFMSFLTGEDLTDEVGRGVTIYMCQDLMDEVEFYLENNDDISVASAQTQAAGRGISNLPPDFSTFNFM